MERPPVRVRALFSPPTPTSGVLPFSISFFPTILFLCCRPPPPPPSTSIFAVPVRVYHGCVCRSRGERLKVAPLEYQKKVVGRSGRGGGTEDTPMVESPDFASHPVGLLPDGWGTTTGWVGDYYRMGLLAGGGGELGVSVAFKAAGLWLVVSCIA
eukprot:gene7104-biopygen4487